MSKSIKVIIRTRLVNNDHFKIEKLIKTYQKSGTVIAHCWVSEYLMAMQFCIDHSDLKDFKRDLNLLDIMGIEGKIEV